MRGLIMLDRDHCLYKLVAVPLHQASELFIIRNELPLMLEPLWKATSLCSRAHGFASADQVIPHHRKRIRTVLDNERETLHDAN